MKNIDNQSELDREEQISRYMKGEMDSQEESKFLADLKSDEELRQDAITQARLVRGMRQVDDELIKALKVSSETEMQSFIRVRKSPLKKPIVWLSLVASVAVILVVGYKGYDYYHTTRLGMKYVTAFPMETIVRGESDSKVESELQSLFNNVIERKNLSSTTNRLSELWNRANQDTYNEYTDYAPYIGWYLAIGYLEDYEKEETKQLLKLLKEKDFPDIVVDKVNDLLDNIQ